MTASPAIRRVCGTNLTYASLAEWLTLVDRAGGRIEASQRHYHRCRQLYRSLGIGDVRQSQDFTALERREGLFDQARHAGDVPPGHGLQRVFTRSEIGTLLVETRNRLNALRSGRADSPPPQRAAL